MNDTDVQAENTDYKPKLHKNYKRVLQIWLVYNNVVPLLTQEHAALGKIRFCDSCWCVLMNETKNLPTLTFSESDIRFNGSSNDRAKL